MQFLVISEQLASSALAIIFGAFLALCYDAVRLLRIVLLGCGMRRPRVFEKLPPKHRCGEKPPFISMLLVNIGDILYSLFAAASFSVFIYWFSTGRLRWYLLLCAVLGFALYRLSLGRLVMKCLGWTAGAVRSLALAALWLCVRPFVLLKKGVMAAAVPVLSRIRYINNIRKTEKIRKRLCDTVRFR